MRAHDITAPYDVTRCYDIMGFYDATVTSLIRIRSPRGPRPTPLCPYGQPDPSCQPPQGHVIAAARDRAVAPR